MGHQFFFLFCFEYYTFIISLVNARLVLHCNVSPYVCTIPTQNNTIYNLGSWINNAPSTFDLRVWIFIFIYSRRKCYVNGFGSIFIFKKKELFLNAGQFLQHTPFLFSIPNPRLLLGRFWSDRWCSISHSVIPILYWEVPGTCQHSLFLRFNSKPIRFNLCFFSAQLRFWSCGLCSFPHNVEGGGLCWLCI